MLVVLCTALAARGAEPVDAQSLFADYHEAVFQIRVIDNAANNKSSTGTGFLVDSEGLIATNYHVISSVVSTPDSFRIEITKGGQIVHEAKLLNVDVVNDLAIVRIVPPAIAPLDLAKDDPPKGDQVFSLGYPYDLGITVVPGTYNGLAPHSATDRVHFTGSLNPGMSGGPAFNRRGEVIGVNVSTAGNQMSFLVPVSKLLDLLGNMPMDEEPDFNDISAQQLKRNSERMVSEMLAGDWTMVPLGGAHALDEVTSFLRCWGESKDQSDVTDKRPFWARRSCQTDHNIFVNRMFSTGKIELQFYWIQSDDLSPIQFYSYYSEIFRRYQPGNAGSKQDLSNWACEEDFVKPDSSDNEVTKAVFCTRAYKKYKGLYDVLFLQGSLTQANQAHMIHFTLAGTTRELAMRFTERFMDSSVW